MRVAILSPSDGAMVTQNVIGVHIMPCSEGGEDELPPHARDEQRS
jgi:hypothetical protein